MKALVLRGNQEIRLEEVEDPRIDESTDAIVRLTTTAIGGSDLHLFRGSMSPTSPGAILGREGVGVVEAVGSGVRNLVAGERVIIPSTIACGSCQYCRKGWTAQCRRASGVHGWAGSSSPSEPGTSLGLLGLQAERARVPWAGFNLVKVPPGMSDGQAILISDVFPAGYFGARMAEIEEGHSVVVLGCGPVGLFAIASAKLLGAGRVMAVDTIPERLTQARRLGAEIIDFQEESPVEVVMELTSGLGADRSIEAVGVDARLPRPSSASKPKNGNGGVPGSAQWPLEEVNGSDVGWRNECSSPSLTLRWSIEMLARQGVASIVGAFPDSMDSFPIGLVCSRNISVRGGIVHHRTIIPKLIELVTSGRIDPMEVVAPSVQAGFGRLEEAYRHLEEMKKGRMQVALLSG